MDDPRPTLPPDLPSHAHKGDAGRLLCVCGSTTMPGAASLVVRGAQRAGAGLVTLVVFQPEVVACIAPQSPETLFLDVSRSLDLYAGRIPSEIAEHRHDARVVGPGLSRSGRTRQLVRRVVESGYQGVTLFDADALAVLAGVPEVLGQMKGPCVLTPHPGEAAQLLDREIPSDEAGRVQAARELAERAEAVVVLKGQGSVVTDGERVFVCAEGNPGMATAGTGDVLSGIAGAYLCSVGESYSVFDAVVGGVGAHARAGDLAAEALGPRGVIASDLITHLPAAQRALGEEARSA